MIIIQTNSGTWAPLRATNESTSAGPHLDEEDDEEIEVGNSSELFEQILGDEVPDRVLHRKTKRVSRDLSNIIESNRTVLTV